MKNLKHIFRMRSKSRLTKYFSALIFVSACFATEIATAQKSGDNKEASFVVKGVVRDAHSKEPLTAVQIQSMNYPASATSDAKGEFTINLPDGGDVLRVTAFDYDIREFPLRGKDEVIIDLYPEAFTDQYKTIETQTGMVKNSYMVNSAQSIDNVSDNFALTADDLIQTKLGGNVRSISRSGTAAMGSSIFIRGLNSVMTNAQPLFVIDGVIWNNMNDVNSIHQGFFSNPLANINVVDIESITVIKDGASIYGSKAANGVILINTKRGKGVVTKINANVTQGVTSEPGSIPMMNGDDHRIYISEILGTNPNFSPKNVGNLEFLDDDPSTTYYKPYHNSTNWNDQIYQVGRTQNYSIDVNGGDDRALYYFSLGYTTNKGIIKTTNLERLSTRFNADFKMSELFALGLNVGYSNIDRRLVDDGINFMTSPTYLAKIKSPFLSPFVYTTKGQITKDYDDADIFNVGNPAAIIDRALNTSKHYRFNIGAIPTFNFTKNLSLSSQFDYSLDKTKESHFTPMLGMGTFIYNASLTNTGVIENRVANQQMRNIAVYDDTRLKYVFTKEDHSINAVLGWRYLDNYFESDEVLGYNTGTDDTRNFTGNLDFQSVTGINNHLRSISNYLNIAYNNQNKYFLNLSAALDGSSRFGAETEGGIQLFGHSWGFFPSLSGAWLISSESFMKNVNAINFMKLRVGYGFTGNDDIQDYVNLAYFMSERFIQRTSGVYLANLANNQIQWETTARLNGGLDMSIFNERVSLSLDAYSSRTSNLLMYQISPEVAGFARYLKNSGELTNIGYEVNASIKMLNLKTFRWELGLSMGHYKNEITALPDGNFETPVYDAIIQTKVGQAAGVFYGYTTDGVFTTQAEADASGLKIKEENGTLTYFGAGDMRFIDKSGDGIISKEDMQVIGDPNPDFYGSFTSKFAVKNVMFEALFTYSYGNDVYNYLRHKLESGNDYYNQTTVMLTRWTTEGQITDQPRATFNDPMGNARFSDRWIEDGSYLKLKSLKLSYNVPLKGGFIEGLNIWVSADNLWTLTNYLGLDPEFSPRNSVLSQGIDAGLIPLTKSYLVGLRLNL
ncbi:SusC/RagA family TonB-linked outer membrane protein [Saccharicrinis sp. FJH2]|uniref:SusC/RagA family TonB-linked outer membrane protein n=1 Tax=Saccharicrinis sp. FJH65 TaxID=3344659 RepID=UPI0035F2FBEC